MGARFERYKGDGILEREAALSCITQRHHFSVWTTRLLGVPLTQHAPTDICNHTPHPRIRVAEPKTFSGKLQRLINAWRLGLLRRHRHEVQRAGQSVVVPVLQDRTRPARSMTTELARAVFRNSIVAAENAPVLSRGYPLPLNIR